MKYPILLLTLLLMWHSAVLTEECAAKGYKSSSEVAVVEMKNREYKEGRLARALASLGYKADEALTSIVENRFDFKNVSILIFGTFATSQPEVRRFLQEKSTELRDFVRSGGCVIMFSQYNDDWSEESWLLDGLTLFRSKQPCGKLGMIEDEHPLFSTPNVLTLSELNEGWIGMDELSTLFRAVSRGSILAAQDERGRYPWCVEYGWGKGRAIFLAGNPLLGMKRRSRTVRVITHNFLDNLMHYAGQVAKGRPAALPDHAIIKETKTGIEHRAAYYTSKALISFEAEVNAAADRGVACLKTLLQDDNWWERERKFPAGTHALMVVALLGTGVNKHDPCIKQLIDHLLENPPIDATYDLGLTLMAFDAWAAPMYERFDLEKLPPEKREKFKFERDLAPDEMRLMERCRDQLIHNQAGDGWWSYGPISYLPTDISNTQIAVLGLKAAMRCGLKIPAEVWEKTIEGFLENQFPSGDKVSLPQFRTFDRSRGTPKFYALQTRGRPWGYRPIVKVNKRSKEWGKKAPPVRVITDATGSRTCMGISSLLFAYEALILTSKRKAAPYQDRVRDAVRDGMGWLWTHWSVEENPHAGFEHYYYYLYALERVGVVAEKQFIGDKDWFHEGATALLRRQDDRGSWNRGPVETCFALMFLKRTTPPPVITAPK